MHESEFQTKIYQRTLVDASGKLQDSLNPGMVFCPEFKNSKAEK